MKADNCFGFGINEQNGLFYFIDEFKQIQILKRIPEARTLQEQEEMAMKDKDRNNFKHKKNFQSIIIGSKYLI